MCLYCGSSSTRPSPSHDPEEETKTKSVFFLLCPHLALKEGPDAYGSQMIKASQEFNAFLDLNGLGFGLFDLDYSSPMTPSACGNGGRGGEYALMTTCNNPYTNTHTHIHIHTQTQLHQHHHHLCKLTQQPNTGAASSNFLLSHYSNSIITQTQAVLLESCLCFSILLLRIRRAYTHHLSDHFRLCLHNPYPCPCCVCPTLISTHIHTRTHTHIPSSCFVYLSRHQ